MSFMHFPEFSCAGEEEEGEDTDDEGGWTDKFVPAGKDEGGAAERRRDNPRIQTNWCTREQS